MRPRSDRYRCGGVTRYRAFRRYLNRVPDTLKRTRPGGTAGSVLPVHVPESVAPGFFLGVDWVAGREEGQPPWGIVISPPWGQSLRPAN